MASRDDKVLKQTFKRTACLIFTFSLFFTHTLDAAFLDPPLMLPTRDPVPLMQDAAPEISSEARETQKTETQFFCRVIKNINNRYEKAILETLILEAVGEGHEGMVAVGEVIRNRSILFGKDYRSVCLMPKQFSCWNDKKRAAKFLAENSGAYEEAKRAWEESETSVLTHGATDYHAIYVQPYWAKSYRLTAQVGQHLFYSRD